jgi:ubiquinone biosynthesis protein UbiJ
MNVNFDLPKSTVVRAINHVLSHEQWALRELQKHQGRVVQLSLPLGSLQVQIQADSLLVLLNPWAQKPDLTIELSTQSLSVLHSANGSLKERAIKAVKISGDAELAQLIAKLANQLRWEYEEDLSKIIGDAPAHFVTTQAKRFASLTQQAIADLQQNVIEYLSEEKKILLHQRDFESHKIEVQKLRDAVERLDKRISNLQKN